MGHWNYFQKHDRLLLSLLLSRSINSVYIMAKQYLLQFTRSDACQWCPGSVIHSPSSLLCLFGKFNFMYCNRLLARVILLECVICFPCLSEYGHQPIPALHIPCTAWNITFISIICQFRCRPLLFLHNNLAAELLMIRLVAGLEHGLVCVMQMLGA